MGMGCNGYTFFKQLVVAHKHIQKILISKNKNIKTYSMLFKLNLFFFYVKAICALTVIHMQ